MFKFLVFSLLLAGAVVGVIVFGVGPLFKDMVEHGPAQEQKQEDDAPQVGAPKGKEPAPANTPAPATAASVRLVDKDVTIEPLAGLSAAEQQLILQGGTVLTMDRQEVPSEREGKLLALATPVQPDEFVPKDKEIRLELAVLAIEYKEGDDLSAPLGGNKKIAMKEPFTDPREPGKRYRFPRLADKLAPRTTKTVRMQVRLRKLAENDEVREGQLVGIINPAISIDDMETKQSNVDAAASDVDATKAMLAESIERYDGAKRARTAVPGSISRDDFGAAKVTVDKYRAELTAKEAAVVKAQKELSAAWTTLDLYFIRATIPGRIRTIYKQAGEAVKALDPVMQIQNTKKLRVEAQVQVQDALPLRERLRGAEAYRSEAASKEIAEPKYAKTLRDMADELTKVYVEVTKPLHPKAALSGDLFTITAVAVTRDTLPRIISASEQGMVRVWQREPGPEERWREQAVIPHHVAVRALACSGLKAERNLLVTATTTGKLRLIDLGKLDKKELAPVFGEGDPRARHSAAVNAVALSADGKLCASAGEDRAICIWDTDTRTLLRKKEAAHNNGITSLAFTKDGRLVSAGRDGRVAVWEWKDDLLTEVDELRGRSNSVSQLGVDSTNDRVLFDEGRELRVLSLRDTRHQIDGTLSNTGSAGTFSTMALFSHDGKTILTNGNAPGRLQLWRAPSDKVRAAELRQLLWMNGTVTCGAFDPAGQFAVTGTNDHRVLVWDLPRKEEAEKPLEAQLSYVEEYLDTGLKPVTVKATIVDAKDWVIPGSSASIVVPPRPAGR